MFVAQFAQFLLNNSEDALLFCENVAQILDSFDEVLVFVINLFPLEPGQLIETKVQNFVCLMFAEGVTPIREARRIAYENSELLDLTFGKVESKQFYTRFIAIGGPADNTKKFVEIGERNQITFERFRAFFSLAQFKSRATQDYIPPMLDVSGVSFL